MQKILSFKELLGLVPFSRSHVYNLIASGDFPSPRKIGKSRVGFAAEDIQKWRDSRPKAQIGGGK